MAAVLLSDIDGTLVDSNALHAEAYRRAFERFGIEVGMDEAWSQIGKGGDQLIPVFVPEADRERLEPEIKKFRKEVFHRDYMPRIVSFAKARELLARVKKSGRGGLCWPRLRIKGILRFTRRSWAWRIWWTRRRQATMRRLRNRRRIFLPRR